MSHSPIKGLLILLVGEKYAWYQSGQHSWKGNFDILQDAEAPRRVESETKEIILRNSFVRT